jgi:hypothetical protein
LEKRRTKPTGAHSPKSGGGAPVSRYTARRNLIERHPEHPELCYHDCPACGQRIPQPFLSGAGPVAYLHRRRGAPVCRVIVHPGTGQYVVHGSESLEDALVRQVGGVTT